MIIGRELKNDSSKYVVSLFSKASVDKKKKPPKVIFCGAKVIYMRGAEKRPAGLI